MANQKQGLDYFDLSVDFFDDDKIALVEAEMGVEGSYIALRLLAKIYRINGYYMQWGEDERLLFARNMPGINADTVQRAVDLLVKRGFFDADTYHEHNVLTSRAIQRRYFAAVKRRNADNKERKYYLLDDSVNIMSTESGKMYAESPKMSTSDKEERSKEEKRVEESRVEKSRVDTPPQTPPLALRSVGVSESGGGASSSFSDFITSANVYSVKTSLEQFGIPENDIWEYVRLTSAQELKPSYAKETAEAWVKMGASERVRHPFYEVVQAHQQLEQSGRIHPMPYEDFKARLFIHLHILGSDQAVIYGMIDKFHLWNECKRLVSEVIRPGSNINQPGKFIIAGLRRLQSNKNQ